MTDGVAIVLPAGLAGSLGEVALRGAVIVVAAVVVNRLLLRRSAGLRHLLWTLALGALLLLPVVRLVLPEVRVGVPVPDGLAWRLDEHGIAWPAEPAYVVVGTVGADWMLRGHATPPAPEAGSAVEIRHAPGTGRMPGHARTAITLPPGGLGGSGATVGVETWSDPGAVDYTKLSDLLVLIWLIGVGIVALPVFTGLHQLARIGRTAPVITDDRILDWARVARRELGVRRPVRLIEGPVGAMPITWGVRRPVVLLPGDATGWSDDRLLAVLRHEFAHVARHDALTQGMGELAVALHWFNPVVWYAASRQRIEREHACDDRVLACGPRASDYATALVDLARSARAARTAALAGLAMARTSGLRDRLVAVLDADRNREGVSRSLAWRIAAFTAIPVILMACVAPVPVASRFDGPAIVGPVLAPVAPPDVSLPAVPAVPPGTATGIIAPARIDAHLAPLPHPATIPRPEPLRVDAAQDGASLTARLLRQARRHGVSDNEMANLLVLAAQIGLGGDDEREAFFEAGAGMRSDYAKRRAAAELLADSPGIEDARLAVRLSATLRSDGERGRLLQAVLDAVPLDRELLEAVLASASDMRSSGEQKRVMDAIDRRTGR